MDWYRHVPSPCDLGLSEWRGRRVDVEGEGAVRRIEVRDHTTGSGRSLVLVRFV